MSRSRLGIRRDGDQLEADHERLVVGVGTNVNGEIRPTQRLPGGSGQLINICFQPVFLKMVAVVQLLIACAGLMPLPTPTMIRLAVQPPTFAFPGAGLSRVNPSGIFPAANSMLLADEGAAEWYIPSNALDKDCDGNPVRRGQTLSRECIYQLKVRR